MHTKRISLSKSVTWRLIGIALLALVTWFVTMDIIVVTIITFLHHLAFLIIFYFHDRAWGSVSMGYQVWVKAFTYEIVLGFMVLAVITFVVTGSWAQVSRITVIYLGIRFILFPVHEYFYDWCNRRRQAY